MNEIELAYLAGLFDGEGSISINSERGGYSPRIAMEITYYPSLADFQRIFGGKIIPHDRNNGHKKLYAWRLYSADALKVCELLLPYLREKKPQAEVLIEYCKKFPPGHVGKRNNRNEKDLQEWYYQKLQ